MCIYICYNHTYSAYVCLHSCVALQLALSMNGAANFCSPINIISKISHNFHLSLEGGRHSFTLPEREGGREGEGEGEGEREMESEWEKGRKRWRGREGIYI